LKLTGIAKTQRGSTTDSPGQTDRTKHQIVTDELQRPGMEFGGQPPLE
jgi:hypothetical protein